MTYTLENTLSEIIFSNLRTAEILENYNFNYSINGKVTLKEVCSTSGIQPVKILNELNKLNGHERVLFNISEWKLDFLCEYIESNHHSYIRKSFQKIITVSKLLSREKKIDETVPAELQKLSTEFEIHMHKEEKLLFPYIKKLVKLNNEKAKYENAPFGTAADIIKVMIKEHFEAHESFESIKKILDNYRTKRNDDEAVRDFKKLLKEFESDFHIHVYIENYLLFPGAVSLEKKFKSRSKIFNNNSQIKTKK